MNHDHCPHCGARLGFGHLPENCAKAPETPPTPPDEIAVMRKKMDDAQLRIARVLSIVDPKGELGAFPECFVAVLNRIRAWKKIAAAEAELGLKE